MQFMEPRQLTAGWIKRAALNATRLVERRPIVLGTLFVLPFMVAVLIKTLAAVMLAQILGFLLCTIAAVKADKGPAVSWGQLFRNFLQLPGSLGFAVGIAVFIYASMTIAQGIPQSDDVMVYSLLCISLLGVLISYVFLMMVAMLMATALMLLSIVIRRPLLGLDVGNMQFPGLFTHQILVDQGGRLVGAMRLSKQGQELNKTLSGVLGGLCILAIFFPLLFGFIGVWLYPVYKEVFFGDQGLHDAAPVRRIEVARAVRT